MKGKCQFVLKSTVIALLFVLSGVLGHIKTPDPFLKTVFEWSSYGLALFLLVEWAIRIRTSVIHKTIRSNLLAIASLTIFWHVTKVVKWFFATDETTRRYLWYLFYVAIILLPLLSVWAALCVGRSYEYRIDRRVRMLIFPAFMLLGLVITNDRHQLVFRFRADFTNTNDEYSRNIGYYIIVAWVAIFTIWSLITLYKRCRIPDSKKRILLPFVYVFLVVVYCVGYPFLMGTFVYRCLDLTTVCCMFIYGIWNTCAAVGLINTNTRYEELFELSKINALITDTDGNVIYASKDAPELDRETLLEARERAILLPGDNYIKSTSIRGGSVYWLEDVSEVNALLEKLREDRELLCGREELLKADIEVKEKRAKVEKKLELYTKLYDGIHQQFAAIDTAFAQINDMNASQLLKRICLLSAYIKRRSNLLLLSEHEATARVRELSLALKETLNYLSLFGVECNINASDEGVADIASLIDVYSRFEKDMEELAEHMSLLYLKLSQTPEELMLNIIAQLNDSDEVRSYHISCKKGGRV